MLTLVEKMLFILLALFVAGATYANFREMYLIVNRGQGKLYLNNLPARLWNAISVYLTQRTTLRMRRVTSLFHLAVVWGFTYFLLVNIADGLEGFIPGFKFLGETGVFSDAYRLFGDVLSVGVLVGVAYLLYRRFASPMRRELSYHPNVLLHPAVRDGAISRDSLLVGTFILLHVG